MGGFVLCNKDGQPTKTLSLPHFRRLVRENVIDFPRLTSLEIQERSNFHPVFAFIALLQATWFVSQCVSRFVHASSTDPVSLVITQFEAVTAPLVIVNWCIFIFAWKKPLDPQCPILIKPNVGPGNRGQLPGLNPTIREIFESEQNLLGSQITECRFQLEFPQSPSTSITRLRLTLRSLISIFLWPIQSIYHDATRLVPPSNCPPEFPDGTLKIPLFYVQNTMTQIRILLPVAVVSAGVNTVSLLFILRPGSTLHFPSEGVKLVWRIASITSTSFSVVTLGLVIVTNFFYFLEFLDDSPFCGARMCCTLDDITGFFIVFWFFMLIVGFAPFFVARVVLLVSSVICLRSVPGGVFMSQSWVDYIPHFS